MTDQHSQLQLYTEGPFDKVITFLKVEAFRAETPIPHGCDDVPTIAFLGGKSHNQLIEAERQGTEYALYRSGRMSARPSRCPRSTRKPSASCSTSSSW